MSKGIFVFVTCLSVLCNLTGCNSSGEPIVISGSSAMQVTVIDIIQIESPVRVLDSSKSYSCPIVSDDIVFYPTTILDDDDPTNQYGDPSVKTGLTAIDIQTGDTLWVSLAGTPSDQVWPLMGSLDLYHDSLIMVSFIDSLYLFDSYSGEITTVPYSTDMQDACSMNRELEGDIFSALAFVSNGERIAYIHYPDDYERESNEVYDIVVTDSYMNPDCNFNLNISCREISIHQNTYHYEGDITDYLLTDSSLCFHTVDPELFFEISFAGRLIRLLILGDDERYGPVIQMAAPYEGFPEHTQTINENIVLDNGHLYTLRTGLNNDAITGAEILDTDLGSNTAILYKLNITLGWIKFSGNGRIFIADWFEIPMPYEGELYEWTGKDFYAFIRLH